jgi:translocation and assembly module TamB
VAEVSDLSVEAPGLRLGGTARADLATLLTEGSARLSITDARTLAAWGAPGLAGSLTADVTLDPSGDRQHVTATARGADVSLSDGAVSLGALTVDATVDDAFGGAAITAKVRSETGGAGAVQWDTLAAHLNGTADDLTATVDLSGTGPTGPLTLAAATRVRPGESRATLTRLTLDNAGRTVAAQAPATVTWVDGVRVDRLAVDMEDGVVTVQGGMTGDALDVSVSAEAVPLTLAELAAPDLGLSGRLDATLTLSGRLPTPEGTLRVGVRDVSFDDAREAPPLAADVSGRLGGGRLTAEATLSGFAERPARATADLPLVLGADGPIPPDAPLSASVDWDGPVGRVWEMLPLIDHRLSGNLMLTATVDGTLAAPGIAADVRLTDGEYEHLTAGTLIDDLSVTASATGTDQVTVSLSGTDGGAGRLTGEGDVRLGEEGPEGAVSVRLDKAMVVRRDDVTASADADLTLDLEGAAGSRLSGWVKTGEVRVRLVGAGAAAVQDLETVEIRDETGTAMAALERAAAERGSDEAAATGPDVALDIAVRMPNRVYVTGQGLDSEWGGDLQVGGTAAAPRINGTIDIRRGTIEVIGRTLTIRTGQIRFAGGRRINPLIDILAAYETSDAEARIGLRGPADDPQFVLESTPPRPRDEVLSLILFDKRTGELTTLETVQLARALAALTGVGGGTQTGILDTVRQATGLDVLRFGQGGEGGGPGVEAGTYLGDDIYVGVEQGIDAGDGGVSVEVDLGAGFRVESKARRSGAGEVGVLWRRDY